jgi:hypothetical protein
MRSVFQRLLTPRQAAARPYQRGSAMSDVSAAEDQVSDHQTGVLGQPSFSILARKVRWLGGVLLIIPAYALLLTVQVALFVMVIAAIALAPNGKMRSFREQWDLPFFAKSPAIA